MNTTGPTRSRRRLRRAAMMVGVAAILIAVPVFAASPIPSWAYLFPDAVQPVEAPRTGTYSAPGSSLSLTQPQIDDHKSPPDWYSGEHAPLPTAVKSGGALIQQKACSSCHLVSGMGHPESGSLAGLPYEYLSRQIAEFKSGTRTNDFTPGATDRNDLILVMAEISKSWSPADMAAALKFYAQTKPLPGWIKVIESTTVPKSYVRKSYARFALPGTETELLGNRIIELPADPEATRIRDPKRSGTIAYVPIGAVARGKKLAESCAACHGGDMRGTADFPGIAGRSPIYAFRQLFMFKSGSRRGEMAALMKPQAEPMSERDMIDVSAYLATLKP